MLRAGETPGRGGTLCLAGDCGNCLATVDGVAYVRTCQTAARPGLAVVGQSRNGLPPLPVVRATAATATPLGHEVEVRRAVVDVAVVGGGSAGVEAAAVAERAGKSVLVLDAHAGDEVVAIYAGPRSSSAPRRGCCTSTPRRSSWRRVRPRSTRSARERSAGPVHE